MINWLFNLQTNEYTNLKQCELLSERNQGQS